MNRRQFIKSTIAGTAALGLAGCTSSGGNNGSGNNGGGNSDLPDSLTFGLAAPLSGGSASIGEKFVDGIEAALADGGLLDDGIGGTGVGIELVKEDTKCSSEGGSAAARKLIQRENVDAFFSVCTPSTLASMPVTRQGNTFHMTSALAKEITQKGHPTLLRTGFRADWISVNHGRFAYDQGLRRVASLNVDNAYGQSYANGFKRGFEEKGGTVAMSDAYAFGSTSFDQFLSKYENADIDGVMEVGYTQHHRVFIPAFRKRLTDLTLVAATDANDPSNVRAIGLSNYADGGGALGARIIGNNDVAATFKGQYVKTSGREVSDRFGAWGWNAVNIIKKSIEAAGATDVLSGGISKSGDDSDTAKMVDAMKSTKGMKMVWGNSVTFNQKGDIYFKANHGKYTNSGFEIVQRIPIKDGR